MARTLPAFSTNELERTHHLLAARVAYMMGRKFEEGDWAHVYTRAKGIPNKGWSNLNIDVMHQGLGVEHKMYCYRSRPSITEACGTSIMHPAATRAIRIPEEDDPNKAMRNILQQYAQLLEQRRKKVLEDWPKKKTPDMRVGWLLWQETLAEFLYFEERMTVPDPSGFYANWNARKTGVRRGSRNLWIYEKETGRKRYSVTSEAGAKIQPYFDVPPIDDPNLYVFAIQGWEFKSGLVRLWLMESTALELERLLGNLDCDTLSNAILGAERPKEAEMRGLREDEARSVEVTRTAYDHLREYFDGVSDEHRMQLLLKQVREKLPTRGK